MTEKEYQEKIPPWCLYRTVEEHKEYLMLCWGILGGLKKIDKNGIEVSGRDYCCGCEFYRDEREK